MHPKITLKSLIEEHARLDFSDFLSTLLAIFHVINKKFHPARLLTYLVKKRSYCCHKLTEPILTIVELLNLVQKISCIHFHIGNYLSK